jgi:hydrogenase nickel incorporation protein HypA/HybF
MHELTIASALIQQAGEEVRRAGQSGRVVRLEVQVGRLSGVNPDSLQFAFGLLAAEGGMAGSALAIVQPPAACACRACGTRSEIDQIVVQCPVCGSPEVTIEGGRELLLQSIELEE